MKLETALKKMLEQNLDNSKASRERQTIRDFRSFGVSKRYPKLHTSLIEDRSNNAPDAHHKKQREKKRSEKWGKNEKLNNEISKDKTKTP